MKTAKESDIHIYSRLLAYVLPYWGAFLLSILGFLLYSVSNVAFVQLVSYIVDSMQPGFTPPSKLNEWFAARFGEAEDLSRTLVPIGVVLIAFSRGLGTFAGNYYISLVSNWLVHNLRVELFNRLLTLPSTFYDKQAMGHLVARVTFHVTQVAGAATDAVRVIIREGFTVIAYLAFLVYLNWQLTIIFFTVAPVIALLVSFAGRRFRRISERIQHSMGDVTQVATEAVQGYKEVRTFGGKGYESDRFDKVSGYNRRQSMKMAVTSALSTPAIQLMVSIALAALLWLLLDPALREGMTPGSVVAFITTSGLLAKPLRQLSEVNATVQKGLAAAADIFGLFDEKPEPDQGRLEIDRVKGEVEFRGVSFSYGQGLPQVLKDISFKVHPGETVALVGRSGSGKSTLAGLIPRFHSPSQGEILIDGHPLGDFALDNLRAHIAIVSQQVTLFNDTVARNIAYGALQAASQEAICTAADRAYARKFIERLPHSFDTVVGDSGVLLSGGQRQRLAIARAFLKDAPILILDEATSALDAESERYIQRALEAVVKGRTTFIIAHRLSTIEQADRIIVIDEGTIVEQGTHQQLLSENGFYAKLHAGNEIAQPAVEEPVYTPIPVEAVPDRSMRLVNAWYEDAFWLRLLTPLAFIYRQLVRLRRRWFAATGSLPFKQSVHRPPVPVIVIGNINVGGTGKSPLVIALAGLLQSLGFKPGIVSRGYGGKATDYPLEVSESSLASEVGDEPIMIHNRTGCPVVVDPNRVRAVKQLLAEQDCDLVISDDGLQHYALGRDLEIAVVDGERGLGNGLCLPAGPLREPASRLNEVDLVVVNGGQAPLQLDTRAKVEPMHLAPSRFVNVADGSTRKIDFFARKQVHAVAGIGHPQRFFATLERLGCQVIQHPFPDHFPFRVGDLVFGGEAPVIMTEKDAVRLSSPGVIPAGTELWYLEVAAELQLEQFAQLIEEAGIAKA